MYFHGFEMQLFQIYIISNQSFPVFHIFVYNKTTQFFISNMIYGTGAP